MRRGLCFRKCDRASQQIVRSAGPFALRNDVIDDARRQRSRRRHRLAVGRHVERKLRAREARQPLRAARAGNDAEQHFRLSDFRVFRRDAEMARLRDLEPAAERVAVDRRDERLRRVLHPPQQRVRAGGPLERIVFRLQRVEHFDVRAGDERRSGADEHDRFGRGIRDAALDGPIDAVPHSRAQRIHRRVVDRDDGDAVFDLVANRISHDRPRLPTCDLRRVTCDL